MWEVLKASQLGMVSVCVFILFTEWWKPVTLHCTTNHHLEMAARGNQFFQVLQNCTAGFWHSHTHTHTLTRCDTSYSVEHVSLRHAQTQAHRKSESATLTSDEDKGRKKQKEKKKEEVAVWEEYKWKREGHERERHAKKLMSQGHLNNITVYPNSAVCKRKDSGT